MVIPVSYGDSLFNKIFFDIEGNAFDLVSALLFSSKGKINISKEELVNRAKELQQKSNHQDIEKLDKFAGNLLTEEIITDKFKPFKDEYKSDPEFKDDNLKNYFTI